jgi:hypothetical protein
MLLPTETPIKDGYQKLQAQITHLTNRINDHLDKSKEKQGDRI